MNTSLNKCGKVENKIDDEKIVFLCLSVQQFYHFLNIKSQHLTVDYVF